MENRVIQHGLLKAPRVMKEKAVWLVAGGPMQARCAAYVRSLGYKLILTDGDANCACVAFADYFSAVDTFNIDDHLFLADKLTDLYELVAVITVAADCHYTVASLCKYLGLPGVSTEVSLRCRHKHRTRAILTETGILQPKYLVTSSIVEARDYACQVSSDCVIKATDSSGSRGIAMLVSPDDLSTVVFSNALLAGTTGSVIIEECLIPRSDCISELSVETLWSEGTMYWLNWVDRIFSTDLRLFPELFGFYNSPVNLGVELGHINPATHGIELRHELNDLIYRAGLAIGMGSEQNVTFLKADIMLTTAGPVILELTPRLSGGWDSSASTPMRGANFQFGAVELALGRPLDLEMWIKHFDFKDASLYSVITAEIPDGASSCLGRRFALGADYSRVDAMRESLINLKEKRYVL
jgi:biotin carboxylase